MLYNIDYLYYIILHFYCYYHYYYILSYYNVNKFIFLNSLFMMQLPGTRYFGGCSIYTTISKNDYALL